MQQPEELGASKIASILSIGMAILKLSVGISIGSLSLLASGLDSLFDAFASGLGFILLKMSLEPADAEHPYGHSRIESIASLAQGVLLFFVALGFAYSAAQRFNHNFEPQQMDLALGAVLICTLLTLTLWIYLGGVVARTGSSVVAGDRLHYFTDLAGNILLFVGFGISKVWHAANVDAFLTVLLCVFILSSSFKIMNDAIKELVDHADPDAENDIKTEIAKFFPEALGTARVRSRKSGRKTAADVEMLSCRLLTLGAVHDISHNVEEKLVSRFKNLDVIIHAEPCNCANDNLCEYRKNKTKPD